MGTPSTSSITKYGRPAAVVPASSAWATLGPVHRRQRLALADHLPAIHARLDDLERYVAAMVSRCCAR